MAGPRSGPDETDNDCFTTRYGSNGYEVSFKETCAVELGADEIGGATGEARSFRITLHVTFVSPEEKASTVGIYCFYQRGEDSWERVYAFLISPDGSHSITRRLKDEQSVTGLAVSTGSAPSVRVGALTVVEADCAQSADSVVLVLAVNESEFLVASDQLSADPGATFGDPTIGIAGASPGFRAAVKNLRVTELRPR